MAATIADVAAQIAEAVMAAIEKRSGIIKDDLAEAARGVLAKNQTGSSPYLPHMGMMEKPTRNLFAYAIANGVIKIIETTGPRQPDRPPTVVGERIGADGGTELTIEVAKRRLEAQEILSEWERYKETTGWVAKAAHCTLAPGGINWLSDDGTIWSASNGSP